MAEKTGPRKRLKEIKTELDAIKEKIKALKTERDELKAKVKAAAANKAAKAPKTEGGDAQ
jgi:uncharacterized coiled-coil DUF342 family protein